MKPLITKCLLSFLGRCLVFISSMCSSSMLGVSLRQSWLIQLYEWIQKDMSQRLRFPGHHRPQSNQICIYQTLDSPDNLFEGRRLKGLSIRVFCFAVRGFHSTGDNIIYITSIDGIQINSMRLNCRLALSGTFIRIMLYKQSVINGSMNYSTLFYNRK